MFFDKNFVFIFIRMAVVNGQAGDIATDFVPAIYLCLFKVSTLRSLMGHKVGQMWP